jgi:hypothetical protein
LGAIELTTFQMYILAHYDRNIAVA